jgi:copper transport protein
VLVLDRVAFGELLEATYGRLALAKVALLAVALVMAARNRWSIAPALAGDEAASVRRLRSSVRAEVVVLALALAAGSLLAQVSPPEDAGAVPTGSEFVQRASFGDGEVELTVAPGRRGTNELHVTATGPDGALMQGADDLTVSMTLPVEDVGPLEPPMQRITTGHSVSYAEIPLAGRWTIEVTARPSKFEELRATFTVPIGE